MAAELSVLLDSLFSAFSVGMGNGTLEIRYPWLLLCLPLPALIRYRVAPYRSLLPALHVPFFSDITRTLGLPTHQGAVVLAHGRLYAVLGTLVWLSLLVAASQPQWVDPPQEKIIPGRDLLLAVDISQSMETRDFRSPSGQPMDRLSAARLVLDDFARVRRGDRLGLVVFANGAHVQAPFTLDHGVLRRLLAETQTGMAGPRTMIGDAIGLGIRLFESSSARHKVMVLLTDGADTGSRIPPEVAARICAERGITLHTVAIGDPATTGTDKIDSEALQAIARIAGGRFAAGHNLDQLRVIYQQLDALEKQEFKLLTHRQKHPLFFWPLGLALLFGLAATLVALFASAQTTDLAAKATHAKDGLHA